MAKVTIQRVDIEEGWVMFQAGDPAPPPEELPHYLNDTIRGWLVRNKELSIRTTLPIVSGGNTVAIHVWFD
jgi:hypothetical protein